MKHFLKKICVCLAISVAIGAISIPAYALVENNRPKPGRPMVMERLEEGLAAPEVPAPTTAPKREEAVVEETVPEETAAEEETAATMPLYYQNDYPDDLYGNGTVASSGCSITSLAMVATYMTGHEYLPDQLADYFGGFVGNNVERLENASNQLQLPWRKAKDWHESLRAMEDGAVVIAVMNSRSVFTNSQHFVVLTGLTEDGKVLVNDPNKTNYDRWELKDGFANGFPQGYISNGYSGGWIYDVSAMPEEPFIYVPEEKPAVEPRYPDFELTEAEINLLARMVWVEAQGEPLEGQQAVAEVVLNRLAAENFPGSLRDVIYAEGQFGCVPYLDDARPTQTQYEVIESALYGPYVLPMDVVFFARFAVNDNVWGKIGGHVFCHQW